jgi:hypothetical protein
VEAGIEMAGKFPLFCVFEQKKITGSAILRLERLQFTILGFKLFNQPGIAIGVKQITTHITGRGLS